MLKEELEHKKEELTERMREAGPHSIEYQRLRKQIQDIDCQFGDHLPLAFKKGLHGTIKGKCPNCGFEEEY
jgi:hypothetical protein